MSWPRKSLLTVLLLLAVPLASADTITVNTTTDDNANNSLCSLREAVEYFNLGRPQGGYQGCVSPTTDNTATISLPKSADPYLIQTSAIAIRTNLSIVGDGRKDSSVTAIQVVGAHRAFIINHQLQYIPPPCFSQKPPTPPCAPPALGGTAAAPALDPGSDPDGTPNDYLTPSKAPKVTGTLSPLPPAGDSTLIRLYDNPRSGSPVLVGSTTVDSTATSAAWTIPVNRFLDDGVHYLTYTTQNFVTSTGVMMGTESAPSAQLTVAIYTPPVQLLVTLNQVIVKGGCATTITGGCADGVDDNTVVTNDPASSSYDRYALSYTNGLTNTSGNGGVIYSNEKLNLSNVLLQDGQATGKGGGVYLDAKGAADITETELRTNGAANGAAIYAESNTLTMETSLVTSNVVNGTGAVIEVVSVSGAAWLGPSQISNSTISTNTGLAFSLHDNMTLNAVTVVLNSGGGVNFNSSNAQVYNSILVGNSGGDCSNPSASSVVQYSLLLTAGPCPSGTGNTYVNNVAGGPGQLMATVDPTTGKCNSDFGLLCPLADHGGSTFVHMPRVLGSYSQLSDSPIINKASPQVGNVSASNCPVVDQRGQNRITFACDIGAVQMQQVASGQVTLSGGVITFGQTYTQSLGDNLADEELLPAVHCPAPSSPPPAPSSPPSSLADPQNVVAGSYRPDVPGCPWLETAPGRGPAVFNTNGSYSYTPSSDFHGFDRFRIHVVTTLSNLNPLQGDKSRVVSATVVVEPAGSMSSSKVGGAADGYSLVLLGLLGLRWRRGKGA